MFDSLWLVPAIPFASSFLLVVFGPRLAKRAVAWLGAGSIGLSALVSLLIAREFLLAPPPGNSFSQVLWTWMRVGDLSPQIGFYLDPLSLVYLLVVTGVGFLIHLYSVEYMHEDEGYSRFFAYMNLFVASMVVLVLAKDLLLLYLGWEGVGLCSYLLIGFWYRDPRNGLAARKAFIVTRVGDTAMVIGLFLLFHALGTLDIQALMQRAADQWAVGHTLAIAGAALLLGGAVGKSAQLPLQTWLPDAMAGPTPTSALIHAATMVTAGVYLVARTHVLFELAPPVQLAVAVVGAATLLIASFSALTQYDIKRVLAYSTISQIGYMFLALGVGAWAAGIFHFMTHAYFKALLFLAAGAVIHALHEEHNMFKMGGLRRQLPLTFWAFLIGGSALAGLPLITAGFYSKGMIIWESWAGPHGSPVLWGVAVAGAFLTSLYIYRAIFLVFFGEAKARVEKPPGWAIRVPLLLLAVLSLVGGFLNLPHWLGHLTLFTDFVDRVLPSVEVPTAVGPLTELMSEGIVVGVFLLGLLLAYVFFLQKRTFADAVMALSPARLLHRFWLAHWGFDWLYGHLFVQPVVWLARVDKEDFVDSFYDGVARVNEIFHRGLSLTETGRVRWYAGGIVAGSILYLAIILLT